MRVSWWPPLRDARCLNYFRVSLLGLSTVRNPALFGWKLLLGACSRTMGCSGTWIIRCIMHARSPLAGLLRLCWEDSEIGPSIHVEPSFASASVDSLAGSSRVAASISTHQLRRVRGPPLLAPSPSPTTSPISFQASRP